MIREWFIAVGYRAECDIDKTDKSVKLLYAGDDMSVAGREAERHIKRAAKGRVRCYVVDRFGTIRMCCDMSDDMSPFDAMNYGRDDTVDCRRAIAKGMVELDYALQAQADIDNAVKTLPMVPKYTGPNLA